MYDIIGDIHGHADKLVLLLKKLGYSKVDGVWTHPARKLISVGDLIDRGPQQCEVVDILKSMHEAGEAHVIMGNHEFNAVSWFMQDYQGNYLRTHSDKNYNQHREFLNQADASSTWYRQTIEWFKHLPLFFETPEFRCIHAAWDVKNVNYLKSVLTERQQLWSDQWEHANSAAHPLYEAIEYCLKGPELELPVGDTFTDSNQNIRNKIRLKWWDLHQASTYQTGAVSVPNVKLLPNKPLPKECIANTTSETPTFFGHYWMTGHPHILTPKIACLDWSVVKRDGALVAYRYDNETVLDNSKLVWVN